MITLFRIATFIAAIISTTLAVYVFNKKDKSPPLRFLSGLMIANMIYATSYLFEISAPIRSELIFFLNLEYVGITFIPIFWVLIAWSYRPELRKNNHDFINKLRILYVIPIVAIVFIWTNFAHHLMYRSIDMEVALPITLLKVERGPGFWVVNGILLFLFIIGFIKILYNLITATKGYKRHYIILTLASIPPFISYLLVLTQSVPYKLDLSPIAFSISGILIFWGLTNMQLFNMVPIAEHMVVNAMHEAMIVLDTKGCLVESNTQGLRLLTRSDSSIIGMPIAELNPEIAKIFSSMQSDLDVKLTMMDTKQERIFSINCTPISKKHSRVNGYLYLLHDITDVRTYISELEHLASSDGLTNLLNHRHFMKMAQKEAERIQKNGFGQFSLIMFDLDHFKVINDTYGHSAGDMVLQRIGQIVKAYAKEQDLCARYGGEEFIMLLANTPIDDATQIAQRLCDAINTTKFTFKEQQLTVTASFGVSVYTADGDVVWEFALNRADTALYNAKAAGRNRVITAPYTR